MDIVDLAPKVGATIEGVLLDDGPQWVWLRRVDDGLRFDGWCVAARDLHELRPARHSELKRQVLLRQGPLDDRVPDASWAARRAALASSGALVLIHTNDGRIAVGAIRPSSSPADPLVVDEVLADGSPRPGRCVRVEDIERLEWGTRYLAGIEMMRDAFDESFRVEPYVEARTADEQSRLVARAMETDHLVHVALWPGSGGWLSGRIVASSETLLVLHLLDEDALELDGHGAVVREHIETIALDQKSRARTHVLERRGAFTGRTRATTLGELLDGYARRGQLVSVHDDDPDVCFPSFVTACDPDGETLLATVDLAGRPDGDYSVLTSSIVFVEWGTRYLASLEALRSVAADR